MIRDSSFIRNGKKFEDRSSFTGLGTDFSPRHRFQTDPEAHQVFQGVSKNFRTQSITKYTFTAI
jgi:hypothetical protein